MDDPYWTLIGPTIPSSAEQFSAYKIARRVLGSRTKLSLLDLGCGDGRAVEFFRRIDPTINYVGVDIAASPEVSARQRTDARFDTYDGINLPYDDATFDIVFSNQVFEHVANPLHLLKSVSRVLRNDGQFIGSVSQLEPYHSFSLWNYTLYGWYKLLEAAGLLVEEFRPGIDGLTLTYRSMDGRKPRFARYFEEESPFNRAIERRGNKRGASRKQIAHRKIMYCGHLVFKARKLANVTTTASQVHLGQNS